MIPPLKAQALPIHSKYGGERFEVFARQYPSFRALPRLGISLTFFRSCNALEDEHLPEVLDLVVKLELRRVRWCGYRPRNYVEKYEFMLLLTLSELMRSGKRIQGTPPLFDLALGTMTAKVGE